MQLETCHLGRVQGVQRTIHTGHTGGRPRLSEDDKARLAERMAFVHRVLKEPHTIGIDPRQLHLLKLIYQNGLTQVEVAKLFGCDQSTVSRHIEAVLAALKKIFEGGA